MLICYVDTGRIQPYFKIASLKSWIIFSQLLLQDGRINYEEFVAMMRKGNPELASNRRRKWAWCILISPGINLRINYLLIYLCCCIMTKIDVWPQFGHLLTTNTPLWNLLLSAIRFAQRNWQEWHHILRELFHFCTWDLWNTYLLVRVCIVQVVDSVLVHLPVPT
jgi:hypothetical protein